MFTNCFEQIEFYATLKQNNLLNRDIGDDGLKSHSFTVVWKTKCEQRNGPTHEDNQTILQRKSQQSVF